MQKIFMLIQRGITDRTPVCVFPWEKPILEEIHGGNAVEVTLDELCDLRGAVKIEKIKPIERGMGVNGKPVKAEEVPSMRAQYEAMVVLDPDTNPLNNPEAEFGRLAGMYGMHTQVNLPNVEKVYGSVGNFRRAMREYANGRSPDFVGESGPIVAEKPLAQMNDKELKAALRARDIEVPAKAARAELEELYAETAAA